MAETPLTKKLGLKAGQMALLINAPEGYASMLEPLPEGARLVTAQDGETSKERIFDLVQVFAYGSADVERYAPLALNALKPRGMLWWAYPKKSSKISTDISRDQGWDYLIGSGLLGVSLIALDETWSAMRFREAGEVKSR